MINVTYAGDTLIAYKVTGDKNVPRGEITFQADLTPNAVRKLRNGDYIGKMSKATSDRSQKHLEPIMLTEKAASKWGTRQLPRYRGFGQVAEPGFINHKWMDGQLIIIGEEYFSFAWVVSTYSRLLGMYFFLCAVPN
jgi:Cyclin D1 binding domain